MCYLGQIYPVELEIKDTTETNTYVPYLDFQHDFHQSSSDKDMSGNVWNRPSWNFMVDMGISSNIMKFPSPKCYMTFWDMVIYRDTLNWSDISPIFEPITELDLITNFDLITKFREVSIEHCNGCD